MNESPQVVLELFVQGQSPRSTAALQLVRQLCEARLPGAYRLDVIDIYQQPERMREAAVVATPALVRRQPLPETRAVGLLSERRVLNALGLNER